MFDALEELAPPRARSGSTTRRAALTALDQAIGDGDHGINLDRGFTAIVAPARRRRARGRRRPGRRRRAPAERRPDPDQHRRRRGRPALRHGVHAGRRRHRRRRSGARRGRRSCSPRSRRRSAASRPRQGDDRREDDARCAACRRSRPGGRRSTAAPTAAVLTRDGRCGRGRRDGDDPAARHQGPGVVSGRAEHRPPGPGRDVGRAAAPRARRRRRGRLSRTARKVARPMTSRRSWRGGPARPASASVGCCSSAGADGRGSRRRPRPPSVGSDAATATEADRLAGRAGNGGRRSSRRWRGRRSRPRRRGDRRHLRSAGAVRPGPGHRRPGASRPIAAGAPADEAILAEHGRAGRAAGRRRRRVLPGARGRRPRRRPAGRRHPPRRAPARPVACRRPSGGHRGRRPRPLGRRNAAAASSWPGSRSPAARRPATPRSSLAASASRWCSASGRPSTRSATASRASSTARRRRRLIVEPDADDLAALARGASRRRPWRSPTDPGVAAPVTGVRSRPTSARRSRPRQRLAAGADGIGLVRTELLFLGRTTPPSVAEQRATYARIREAMGGRPVVFRTLDVGGDKPAAWQSGPA